MKLSVLDLKTTYELFPTVVLLAAVEEEDGREVCYTFRVDVYEYEEYKTYETGWDQENTVYLLEREKSISEKQEFIEFYQNKVEELGIFKFMAQYELQLYQDPKKIISPPISRKSKKWEYWPVWSEELFVIKEEYFEDTVFLY